MSLRISSSGGLVPTTAMPRPRARRSAASPETVRLNITRLRGNFGPTAARCIYKVTQTPNSVHCHRSLPRGLQNPPPQNLFEDTDPDSRWLRWKGWISVSVHNVGSDRTFPDPQDPQKINPSGLNSSVVMNRHALAKHSAQPYFANGMNRPDHHLSESLKSSKNGFDSFCAHKII